MSASITICGKSFTNKIEDKAFYGFYMSFVEIPEGITEIGEQSFADCKIERIKLPTTLKKIGKEAFYHCSCLTEIDIPDSVTEIGEYAFSSCKNLKRISLPSSLKKISSYAFVHCQNLTEIDIPDSVAEIGEMTFFYCKSLEKVKLPKSLKELKSETFHSCPFKELVLPDSIKLIESHSIRYCNELETLYVPKSVEVIEGPITQECIKLKVIEVDRENSFYDSRENCNAIIETATNTLIQSCTPNIHPSVTTISGNALLGFDNIEKIYIPPIIESLGFCIFSGCKNLKSISIPASVKEIGVYPFSDCPNIVSIEVDKDNKFYDSRNNCNAIIETATNTLIKGCPTTIIPNGVERIAAHAFDNYNNLYELTIPESVTFVEESFVCYCKNLKIIKVAKGKAGFYREMVSDVLKPLIVEE